MGRALLLFARALSLRCPNCGERRLLRSWFRLEPTCPNCGLLVEREHGNFTGSMTINLVVTETAWVVFLVAMMLATWPNPPVALLQWGSIGLMIAVPILFFPFSKTLWLALDLLFRPFKAGEDSRRAQPR
jgi:uncharacterized protein (DUF983 family)